MGTLRSSHALAGLLVFLLIASAFLIFLSGQGGSESLEGRIWSVKERMFITKAELQRRIHASHIVLLGEIHDNIHHHEMQALILKDILASGARPALVMEQFDRDFQDAITTEERQPNATADSVMVAGHFSDGGWGRANYGPLVELAVQNKLPIIAANVSRDDMCKIIRDPKSVQLPKLDPAVEQKLAETLRQSHGGGEGMDAKLLEGLITSQRARDAMMAKAVDANASRGVVLIAGIMHVRRGHAAPLYLHEPALIVGFVEDPLVPPQKYFVEAGAELSGFDYLWFTKPVKHEAQVFTGFCE